jgi:predicted nucleotide-binding protein
MDRKKQRRAKPSQNNSHDPKRRVFLDIPYHRNFRNYERAIVTTLLTYGLRPVIAKDSKKTALILEDVCELIRSAKYAVVDISGLNFNVAFEAGYLHALGGRNFILLKNKGTSVPADLQGLKYNEYSSSNTLAKTLTVWLKQNVPEAKLSPHAGSIAKVIRKIMKDASVSEDMAKDMLLTMMENLTKGDRILPFN